MTDHDSIFDRIAGLNPIPADDGFTSDRGTSALLAAVDELALGVRRMLAAPLRRGLGARGLRVAVAVFAVVVVGGLGFWLLAPTGDGEDEDRTVADTAATTTTTIPGTESPPSTLGVTTSSTAAFQRPSGGEIEYMLEVPIFLNPIFGGAPDLLAGAIFRGAWRFDADRGEIVADLITEMPSLRNGGLELNADGTLTVRYRIEPDAVWSDGTPVSGDDFAFTYDAVMETIARIEADAASDESEVIGSNECGDLFLENLGVDGEDEYLAIDPDSIVAGPKSFEYTVTDPTRYESQLFRWLIPRHAVEGTDLVRDWLDRTWPTAGPFVVESFGNGELSLVRNDNYWKSDPETGQQLPYLDRIVLSTFLDEFAPRLPEQYRDFHRYFHVCFFEQALEKIGLEPGEEGFRFAGEARHEFDHVAGELYVEGVVPNLSIAITDARFGQLEAQGVEFDLVNSGFWEHLSFNFGDPAKWANADTLVADRDFRVVIAHALDRGRLAAEALGKPVEPIGSLIDAYTTERVGAGWDVYDYDPEAARALLADLCTELGRDCVADPPTLVFSVASDRPDRRKLGELVAEMLGDVGIVVELDDRADLFAIVELEDCRGWEMTTWAWGTSPGFRRVADVFEIFAPLDGDQPNLYRWGTDAVPGGEKPGRSFCEEPEGPSSVRDEFTERYAELAAELRGTVDPDRIRSLVRELEDILVSQVAMIPLYVRPVAVAHRSDIIGGYGFRQRQGPPPDLWNVELWYRADR